MIEVIVNTKERQLMVIGHDDNDHICGAITMLTRAAGMIAKRSSFKQGLSILELYEDLEKDFDALVFGITAILERSTGYKITHEDKALDGPRIQTV